MATATRPISEIPALANRAVELLSLRGPGFSLSPEEATSQRLEDQIEQLIKIIHKIIGEKEV